MLARAMQRIYDRQGTLGRVNRWRQVGVYRFEGSL